MEKSPLSIAQYIELLNEQLKLYDAHLIGEITQVKTSARGHVYFTLKDKEQDAILECVMWAGKYALYGITLEVGMEIIASGTASIYAPWGKLSFVADAIELVGEGALKKKYDALKRKLASEGLFADERKQILPSFPRKIGVITSRQGAVIHDFMNNLGRHGFQITFIDSRVEGAEALQDLYQALRTLKNKDLDVIVLMRGGGSLQSLAAFDAEVFVREVASSPIPVIAAIGHHQDVPLCALAADKAVSTPTAAANLLNTSWDKASAKVTNDSQRILYECKQMINNANQRIELKQTVMLGKYGRIIDLINQRIELKRTEIMGRFRQIFDSFSYVASHVPKYLTQISTSLEFIYKELSDNTREILKGITTAIAERDLEVNSSESKIMRAFAISVKSVHEQIDSKERIINIYNPMKQLSLGYSLIQGREQRLVKSIKDVTIGEEVSIITQDGEIGSQVKSIKGKKHV